MSEVTRCFLISVVTAVASSIVVYVVMSRLDSQRVAAPVPTVSQVVEAPPAPAPLVAPAPVEPVQAPRVVGATVDDARRVLSEQSLRLVLADQRADEAIPEGHILSQSPLPGSELAPGEAVQVTVSLGVPPIELPELAGQPLETARARLEDAGLRVGAVTSRSNTAAKGLVLAMRPAPGRFVSRGSAVELVVSDGPEEVEVPRVIQRNIAAARRVLEEAGLEPGAITWTYHLDFEPNTVVRQKPRPGEKAPRGSVVRLWGSEPE